SGMRRPSVWRGSQERTGRDGAGRASHADRAAAPPHPRARTRKSTPDDGQATRGASCSSAAERSVVQFLDPDARTPRDAVVGRDRSKEPGRRSGAIESLGPTAPFPCPPAETDRKTVTPSKLAEATSSRQICPHAIPFAGSLERRSRTRFVPRFLPDDRN